VFLATCFKYCSRGLPTAFLPDIAPSRMFTANWLRLIVCPIHEWRLFFKSNISYFALQKLQHSYNVHIYHIHILHVFSTSIHFTYSAPTHTHTTYLAPLYILHTQHLHTLYIFSTSIHFTYSAPTHTLHI